MSTPRGGTGATVTSTPGPGSNAGPGQASDSVSNPDPFLSNDFYPLQTAHQAIVSALRADESCTNADLYKRMASAGNGSGAMNMNGTSMGGGSGMPGHLYKTLEDGRNNVHGTMNGNGNNNNSNAIVPQGETNVYHTLQHSNSIPLPQYLSNIIRETKLSSLMGLLPEGNMVWVSVDDALYLWEYGSGSLNSGSG
eukprot:352770_1